MVVTVQVLAAISMCHDLKCNLSKIKHDMQFSPTLRKWCELQLALIIEQLYRGIRGVTEDSRKTVKD